MTLGMSFVRWLCAKPCAGLGPPLCYGLPTWQQDLETQVGGWVYALKLPGKGPGKQIVSGALLRIFGHRRLGTRPRTISQEQDE